MPKESKGVRLDHISKIYTDPKTGKDFYAVHLSLIHILTIAEAAQALRISQSAVKQRLRRANRRLRDRLKEWYYDA